MAGNTRVSSTLVLVLLACVSNTVSSGHPPGTTFRRPTVVFTSSGAQPVASPAEVSGGANFGGARGADLPWANDTPTPNFTEAMRVEAAAEVKRMFHHGYDNYVRYAFPHDELKPLTRSWTDSLGELGNLRMEHLSKSYRGVALTLIDSTTTLAVLNNRTEFAKNVKWMANNLNFDLDVRVNAFECNIRVLGGLLSAHSIAAGLIEGEENLEDGKISSFMPDYDGSLLPIAYDLGKRLLKAFDTDTGMPYAWVNLKNGIRTGETTETNVAAIGSFALEFGTLSRLTGDWRFETASKKAIKAVWRLRSDRDLLGNTIDVKTGRWINRSGGIGAGNDSFFEYLLKAYVAFGDYESFDIFSDAYVATQKWYTQGNGWYHESHLDNGIGTHFQATSLQAFWPGMQVLLGDIESAQKSWANFFSLWQKFGASPERYMYKDNNVHPSEKQYPLRPELIESTAMLWSASGDEKYRRAGLKLANDLRDNCEVKHGYASVKDVRSLVPKKGKKKSPILENHMPSFFLAETCKYLYLLFDDPRGFLGSTKNIVFSTEGHPLPVWVGGGEEGDGGRPSEIDEQKTSEKETEVDDFFDLVAHATSVRDTVQNKKAFRAQTPPGVVDRDDAVTDKRYQRRWVDPSQALRVNTHTGAGYGLSSKTCPDLESIRTAAWPVEDHDAALTAADTDPLVWSNCIEGFVDTENGRVNVFQKVEPPVVAEEGSADIVKSSNSNSPAAQLAMLTKQIEELHKSLMRNKETLRVIESRVGVE